MSGSKPTIVQLTRPTGDPSDHAWWMRGQHGSVSRLIPSDRIGSSVKRAMHDHEDTAFFEVILSGDNVVFGRRVPNPGW